MDTTPTPEPQSSRGVVERKTAYALACLGLEVVQRSTVRALLPKGTTKARGDEALRRYRLGQRANGTRKNRTTVAFGQALQRFEQLGWITRGPDLIRIHDRRALLRHALRSSQETPAAFVDLAAAVQAIREQHTPSQAHALLAQRRRELHAIRQLMQPPVAGVSLPGAGHARIIHKSRTD